MKKYFKEKVEQKISLLEYYQKTEKEYLDVKKQVEEKSKEGYSSELYKLERLKEDLRLKYARVAHIYKALGEIEISEELINTICKTFDSSKCRYGTICIKLDTVREIYEIATLFPELSEEAILEISREYIKDLFDEYSLIETLCMILRKEGCEDAVFEKFMGIVKDFADKEDKKYENEAWHLRIYYGEYSYDFIKNFEEFIKKHHITCARLGEVVPEPEMFLKDQIHLKEVSRRSKDCWGSCKPITFQMLESYLDGDVELSEFEEQPSYYATNTGIKDPTSITKTEFLESIKEKQKTKKYNK